LVVAQLDGHTALSQALRQRLSAGAATTLVVGNHDAELGALGVRAAVLRRFGLTRSAPLTIAPWWIRRNDLHLEHGHVWDPDNAPIHPLIATEHDNEPLGVAVTRQVLAPTGAYLFAHAHQTTPLAGLLRALRELRLHAPEVVVRYFVFGARIFWQAANHRHDSTKRAGNRAILAYAHDQGVSPELVEHLTRLRPTPRHADPAAAFARLYLDRSAATATALLSTAAAFAQHDAAYLLVAAAGLLYLRCSKGDRARRYSSTLLKRVESAAIGIRPLVNAKTVIFGHTHVAEACAGYANTGAFGFPTQRGRPFLLLNEAQQLMRGWFDGDAELEPLEHAAATR
jgi:hypothetical protein